MKNLGAVFLLTVLLILPYSAWPEEQQEIVGKIGKIKDTVYEDHKNFYSVENLGSLAIAIGISGILSNTSADREIQNWYQESLRSKKTDDFSRVTKTFGRGATTVPIYLGATLLGQLTRDIKFGSAIGEWGERSLRAILVGAPPMLFLQTALGASRPNEGNSHWHPFADNNGVSGHSFMGAIPFLAASEITDNACLKYCLYLGSTLCGLSRINDDDHYFSQAALGWWMAYLAATGVNKTEKRRVFVAPVLLDNTLGIKVTIRF